MTNNFREGVFSSHKPLRWLPEAHTNPLHQENSPIELENFRTIQLSKNQFLADHISPEGTGIPNTSVAMPPGSLFYNESNVTISTKLLIPTFKYKFYNSNTLTLLQEKEQERCRKQILFKLLSPNCSAYELFNTLSRLISIPSILIEVHEENDQKVVHKKISEKIYDSRFSNSEVYKGSIISEKFMDTQIISSQWYGFFKTIDMINSNNFDLITWFNDYDHKQLDIHEKIYSEEEWEKKTNALKISDSDNHPLEALVRADHLRKNLTRIKNQNVRSIYEEAVNYIILAAANQYHVIRMNMLIFATKMFLNSADYLSKQKKPSAVEVKAYVREVMKFGHKEDDIGEFKISPKKPLYKNAYEVLKKEVIPLWQYMEKYLRIKRVVKEPKLEKYIHADNNNGYAENFKKYNTQREEKRGKEEKRYGTNILN
jgi:hypothetical protein